jgi:hypothetical protein
MAEMDTNTRQRKSPIEISRKSNPVNEAPKVALAVSRNEDFLLPSLL